MPVEITDIPSKKNHRKIILKNNSVFDILNSINLYVCGIRFLGSNIFTIASILYKKNDCFQLVPFNFTNFFNPNIKFCLMTDLPNDILIESEDVFLG